MSLLSTRLREQRRWGNPAVQRQLQTRVQLSTREFNRYLRDARREAVTYRGRGG